MPNIRWLLALITRLHRALYRSTRGWLGGSFFGKKMLLLRNVGRSTGALRVIPLLYVEDGERFVVVASNGGDDRVPAWWLNLQKRPSAEVQRGRSVQAVRAREASPEEASRLWPVLEATYRYYSRYRRRAQRRIPIVILEPLT